MKTGTLDEFVEVEYVRRADVPQRTAEGWVTIGGAVGTPERWSVLMYLNHMNGETDDHKDHNIKR